MAIANRVNPVRACVACSSFRKIGRIDEQLYAFHGLINRSTSDNQTSQFLLIGEDEGIKARSKAKLEALGAFLARIDTMPMRQQEALNQSASCPWIYPRVVFNQRTKGGNAIRPALSLAIG